MTEFETLWQQVEAIPHPGPAPAPQEPIVTPSRQALLYKKLLNTRAIAVWLIWIGYFSLAMLSVIAQDYPIVLWSVGLIAFGSVIYTMLIPTDISAFQRRLKVASDQWQFAASEWDDRAGPRAFAVKRLILMDIRNAWNQLPGLEAQKLAALQDGQRTAQLAEFLARHKIEDNKFFNIGDERSESLRKAGIQTAGDLTVEKLTPVPGIGPTIGNALLDWRRTLEREFQFNPDQPVSPEEISGIKRLIEMESKDLEFKLRLGIADLRKAQAHIEQVRARYFQMVEVAFTEYRKALADVNILSSRSPA